MGYRSNVKIAARKGSQAQLEMDRLNAKHRMFETSEHTSGGTELVVYSNDWIKWYEDYDDVSEFDDLLSNEDYESDIEFLRIGEDLADIDHYNGINGWLYVETSIAVGY